MDEHSTVRWCGLYRCRVNFSQGRPPILHPAQKKEQLWFCGVSRFWWGSRYLFSLIRLQNFSISSFILNLYKSFTRQWRTITILKRNAFLLLNYVVLLCKTIYGECISSFSTVNILLCVEQGFGGPPSLSFHTLLHCRCSDLVIAAISCWCKLIKSCCWYVLNPTVSSLSLQKKFN